MSQLSSTIALMGGLDLVTPQSLVPPGSVIGASNYEAEALGYSRVQGYERFDGQAKPSEATYLWVAFDAGTTAILEGDVVTGATSGATGTALADATVSSGAYGTSDAAGGVPLHTVTGTFIDNEALQVGGVTRATVNGAPVEGAATSDALHTTLVEAETARRRALISKPPGTGPTRGIAKYRGDTYCWRDNVGATAGLMYKSTAAGWEELSFGHRLPFQEGTVEFALGETVYGGASGASGVVERCVTQTGAWSGDAAGFLVLSGVTGTFDPYEMISGATGHAHSDGSAEAITLPAGATIESVVANFYATEGYERLYFTTRTGRAYEWDGSVLAPIYTGMPDDLDKPVHIAFHRNHLFLSFAGGSLQNSSIGEPLEWSAITGAGEYGFGQEITGLKSETRDSLIVAGRNKIGYLTGSSTDDFDLASITESSGAVEGTLEVIGSPIFLDDLGIRDLSASAAYGDWKMGTMSARVEPYFRAKRAQGVSPVGAFRVRAKDQYRIFWASGEGLSLYMGRKKPEFMPISLGFTPTCFFSGEDAEGREELYAGSDDGWVYQLDAGTSFDGEAIDAFIRLSFLNQDEPLLMKRFHRAMLEGQAGTRHSVISIGADYDYGGEEQPTQPDASATMYGAGGFWGSAVWDEFFWSSAVAQELWFDLYAVASNVSIVIASSTATETPHTLSTLTLLFTIRRRRRG